MAANKPFQVHPIPILKDNYVWILIDGERKNALIVDPGMAVPVVNYLHDQGLTLLAILITHHHWDHTNGIAEIVNHFHAPVYGPAMENIPYLTHPLSHETPFTISNFPHTLQLMNIPGHTSGHVAFYLAGSLFCGDTLFASGCGRIFEGTAAQLFSSLQKIAALPDDTKIYCAHEYTLHNLRFAETVEPDNVIIAERLRYVTTLRKEGHCSLPTTLQEERETNPFLRCHVPAVKASVERHANQHFTDIVEIFTALRRWKDSF